MGLQEVPCAHSTIFLMGLYKIKEYADRCQFILQHILGQYISGFDDEDSANWQWENWDKIQRAMSPFTSQKQIPQVGLSKFYQDATFGSSDGSKTPVTVNIHAGACVQVYEQLKDFGILKDPYSIRVSYASKDPIENENFQIWASIMTAYQTILSTLESLYMVAYSIAPMYYSPRQRLLSPFQMQLYKSDLLNVEMILDKNYVSSQYTDRATYHRIYWKLIDDLFPNLIDTMRKQFWGKFIKTKVDTPILDVDDVFVFKFVGSG